MFEYRPKGVKPDNAKLGLKGAIHKNIATLHSIRRVHTKILILNAAVEESSGNFELPPDDENTEPPILSIPGLTLGEDSGAHCLNRVSTTVLQHAGFEGVSNTIIVNQFIDGHGKGGSQAALDVLQHVAADYLMNVGRTFRFMIDTFGKTMSNEVRLALYVPWRC